jgi:hypothetical protein
VYQPRPLSGEDQRFIQQETRRLIETARTIADHVYLIAQPVAYDEQEIPGVGQNWFDLYPIPGRDAYYDNRSVAEWIRAETSLMVNTAHEMGVPVIDLDHYMRPLLATRDDLFYDKWHYAPAGARMAAELVAKSLREMKTP